MNNSMKLLIGIGIGILGLCAAIFTAAVYHHSFTEEKKAHAAAKEEIKELKSIIQANKENQPEHLNEIAGKFIKTLFYSDGENGKEKTAALKKMTTSKASKNMFESEDEEHIHEDPTQELKNYKSTTKILETFYNRKSEKEAVVTISFNHIIESDNFDTKTLNEAKVKLLFVDNKWLVDHYEVTELL